MSERRNISKETLEKVYNTLPKIIKESLPEEPEKILPYITRLKEPKISPSIKSDVKQKMLDNLMSDDEYLTTFFSIIATFFYAKVRDTSPTLHLVLGQTGSGKSNLTAKILEHNQNTVVIDSDKYKHYRPDAELLAKQSPTLYGFLTGPDAYDHRDNVYDYATNKKYNILIEIAPSAENGLFNVNLDDLQEKGYSLIVHTLAVSKLNSAISIHERYEGQIEAELATPKLTDLNRHNDSFEGLNNIVKSLQNRQKTEIRVYKRAENPIDYPEIVHQKNGKNKYSCAYQALLEEQYLDSKKTETEFKERHHILLEQMKKRKAPKDQHEQLEKVKMMYQENMKSNADKTK